MPQGQAPPASPQYRFRHSSFRRACDDSSRYSLMTQSRPAPRKHRPRTIRAGRTCRTPIPHVCLCTWICKSPCLQAIRRSMQRGARTVIYPVQTCPLLIENIYKLLLSLTFIRLPVESRAVSQSSFRGSTRMASCDNSRGVSVFRAGPPTAGAGIQARALCASLL
ncbi:hypothetical protein CHELA40_13637 [Chelatococcus asaccharovorans]|nr:hypothetical protein CHELA40_13637 [Chelatococcus asaccharovorans]CAH1676654.1 hypothetical protein CHELA17_61986 [Chelatococcus asaccharovorans]